VNPGEVWWSMADPEWPIVLLSGEESGEFRAVQVVAPATEAQKRGFVILSPEEAADPAKRALADAGVEVPLGADEGLAHAGVIRVALPQPGRIFCTWEMSVTRDDLVERAGALPAGKMRRLVAVLDAGAGRSSYG
jgi:mRNA interferase MazF